VNRAGMPHALGAAIGVLIDARWGEPPIRPHPVAVFGTVMDAVEERTYAPTRGAGVLHTGIGVGLGLAAGGLVDRLGGPRLASTALATALAVAGHGLAEAATAVAHPLSVGDLPSARAALPALVGRDASELDASEIARAVIESVAENTVDAIVAPACWAAVAGAPGALGYRAVNTLDAMVGHRSERYEEFGWASARLDDGANWVPARLTAGLVAAVRPRSAVTVGRIVSADAAAHPSPNSGVAEAAFAAALGLRLGGENRYGDRVERRPDLGDGRAPDGNDIAPAVALSRDVTWALVAGLAAVGSASLVLRRIGLGR
jgi:adenosylcobinamide-phosphate synthase